MLTSPVTNAKVCIKVEIDENPAINPSRNILLVALRLALEATLEAPLAISSTDEIIIDTASFDTNSEIRTHTPWKNITNDATVILDIPARFIESIRLKRVFRESSEIQIVDCPDR